MVCPLLLDGARDSSRAVRNAGGSRSQERTMRDAVAVMTDEELFLTATVSCVYIPSVRNQRTIDSKLWDRSLD